MLCRFLENFYLDLAESPTGLDLNPKRVAYCNKRLERKGFTPGAIEGDMSDFTLPEKVDAAFNMINSFRHLASDEQARGHLRSMASVLDGGGLYVLGLHLTPTIGPRCEEESWSARRGNLAVLTHLRTMDLDPQRRVERVAMWYDVSTPTRQFRIQGELDFRTYTAADFSELLGTVPEFETVGVFDFSYDIDYPVTIGPTTEDVVFVLRRK